MMCTNSTLKNSASNTFNPDMVKHKSAVSLHATIVIIIIIIIKCFVFPYWNFRFQIIVGKT